MSGTTVLSPSSSASEHAQEYAVRAATVQDFAAIWPLLKKEAERGETYIWPAMDDPDTARSVWFGTSLTKHEVYVVTDGNVIAGTYYLRPNAPGAGSHIANAGFLVAEDYQKRGIGRLMATHALEQAKQRHYRTMQFNAVIATNTVAIRLWESFGFQTIGRIPAGFQHPSQGLVDVLILHKKL